MSFPTKHYSSYGMDSDGSISYAEGTGQILEFQDVRKSSSFVTFTAFLTSFSQAFSSNWNTEEVLGRMDAIATFKNTTRTISLAWDVPSASIYEGIENMRKTSALAQLLYPSYDQADPHATVMARPPLVRLKFATLISRSDENNGLLGYITSFNWNPVLEMGYWHELATGGSDGPVPKVVSLSVEFTVIHEHELGYDKNNNRRHPRDFPWGLGIRR